MKGQLVSISAMVKNAGSILGKIDKKDKEYQKLNDTLKSINASIRIAIGSFNADKRKLATKLAEANSFYETKYLPISKKISDPSSGLSARLRTTQKDYKEYQIVKGKCVAKFQEITEITKDCKIKSRELSNVEKTILKFLKSAEINVTKISYLLSVSEKTSTQINDIHTQVSDLCNLSKASAQNIDILEKDSRTLNDKVKSYHATADEKLKAIEKVYNIAHETGLSGEFETRRNNLDKEIKHWKWWIFGASLLLLIGVIIFYTMQLFLYNWNVEVAFDLNFYIRFLIFSPLVYYLYFVSSQYNQAKKLHDKYAFKTTLAMVIKSHIELLTQYGYFEEDGQREKILDFILKGFGKIYNEPYADDSYKMKVKIANFEIDLQKKLIEKLSEITGHDCTAGAVQTVIENK